MCLFLKLFNHPADPVKPSIFINFAKSAALAVMISPVIVLLANKAFEIQIAKASSSSGNFGDFSFCLAVLKLLSSIFNHLSLFFKISQTVFFFTPNFFPISSCDNDGFS